MSNQESTGVVVVGSVNMDMLAFAPQLPLPGETLMGDAFALSPGGKGANQAVAAARMGAAVSFVGRVGVREHGRALVQALQAEGVDTQYTVQDAAELPGLAMIMVAREGGENAIVVVPGSNEQLSPVDIAAAADRIQSAQVLAAQLEVPLAAIQQAFALARAAGVRTVLNAAPIRALPPELLALTDWLVLNEGEAAELLRMVVAEPVDAARAAQALLMHGVRHVVITLGGEGAMYATSQQVCHLPGVKVAVVDTVGAGDTFVGGLAAALAQGLEGQDAVQLGQAAATYAVSHAGVQDAMPRRAELANWWGRQAGVPPLPALPEPPVSMQAPSTERRAVIFDTDPGIDDAMALLMLARHPAIDLRAVCTVFGNADVGTTTRNALKLSQLFGLRVPVASGASGPLNPRPDLDFPAHIHGDDGLGGHAGALPEAAGLLAAKPAHELMCDMINAEPGQITLVAVGPLTNLALALRHDPGIAAKVRQVVIMGGAFGTHGHGGNVTPVAEANIINDPEAADLVLTAPWPVVLVGLDVTQEVVMRQSDLASLQGRGAGAGDFIWDITRLYEHFYHTRDGIEGIYSHDASAAAFVVAPEAFGLRAGPVRVALDGIARGQTIQWSNGRSAAGTAWENCPAQQVCVSVDAPRVRAEFLSVF
ncbi:MAG: nucleoside hydrolase [Burkholderiaceae bacterium]|nr:nucleoside hydrolase [Burkholderiaceae bacterium]